MGTMVNITEFHEDLKSGMTLEECLLKHNTTLKTVFDSQLPSAKRKKKEKPRKTIRADKYIQERDGKFYVRKYVKGTTKLFGTYRSLEDARLVRDYLLKHGWKQKSVDSICKKLGVERVKHQRNTVRYH